MLFRAKHGCARVSSDEEIRRWWIDVASWGEIQTCPALRVSGVWGRGGIPPLGHSPSNPAAGRRCNSGGPVQVKCHTTAAICRPLHLKLSITLPAYPPRFLSLSGRERGACSAASFQRKGCASWQAVARSGAGGDGVDGNVRPFGMACIINSRPMWWCFTRVVAGASQCGEKRVT
jgi:hypothetical protein